MIKIDKIGGPNCILCLSFFSWCLAVQNTSKKLFISFYTWDMCKYFLFYSHCYYSVINSRFQETSKPSVPKALKLSNYCYYDTCTYFLQLKMLNFWNIQFFYLIFLFFLSYLLFFINIFFKNVFSFFYFFLSISYFSLHFLYKASSIHHFTLKFWVFFFHFCFMYKFDFYIYFIFRVYIYLFLLITFFSL